VRRRDVLLCCEWQQVRAEDARAILYALQGAQRSYERQPPLFCHASDATASISRVIVSLLYAAMLACQRRDARCRERRQIRYVVYRLYAAMMPDYADISYAALISFRYAPTAILPSAYIRARAFAVMLDT